MIFQHIIVFIAISTTVFNLYFLQNPVKGLIYSAEGQKQLQRFFPLHDSIEISQVFWTSHNEEYILRFTITNHNQCKSEDKISIFIDGSFHSNAVWRDCLKSSDSEKYTWNYYHVHLQNLPQSNYRISNRKFYFNLEPDLVTFIGDTGTQNRQIKNIHKNSIIVHMGDLSYASNDGNCWNPAKAPNDCNWYYDSTQRVRRLKTIFFDRWKVFFEEMDELSPHTLFYTTRGNHDNDPQFAAVFQETSRFQEINIPRFNLRLIELNSEDNFNNPYERIDRSKPIDQERFDMHFGKNSAQSFWLKNVIRKRENVTTIAFSHRPLIHSSSHHPTGNSDWFGNKLLDYYLPLLQEKGVKFFISGHSHHFERGKILDFNISYFVIGNGGMKLDTAHRVNHNNLRVDEFYSDRYGFLEFKNDTFSLVSSK